VNAPAAGELHPLVAAAGGEGRLPEWARCGEGRRGHVERVAGLMEGWAAELGLSQRDRLRWAAAARLHDALRDSGPDELRLLCDLDWPASLLHGPACAARLRGEGVRDEELLQAIAYHSVGHPELQRLGQYLYLADFLEPGRAYLPEVRERLRAILPAERREALLSVVGLRLARRLEVRGPIRLETAAFWNQLVEGDA
jgi:HD superfamily phosphohydrolase YqeK